MSIVAFVLLAAMLVTYVVLDGYDLGVGAVVHLFARSDDERGAAIASIGPFWNGNEVWLIAAGGALFAFFPRAYASSFSGFYLPFTIVLWLLIFRGISLELRSHYANSLWHDFWDWAFSLSSGALALLFGVALGNLIGGLPLDAHATFVGSFALLLNPYAFAVGLLAVLVLAHHGWCYLHMHLPQAPKRENVGRVLWLMVLTFDVLVTALTVRAHPLNGPKLVIAGALGFTAFAAFVASGVLSRRSKNVIAFGASCVGIVAVLGAAVATVYPFLIPSSTRYPGLTIFDSLPNPGALAGIVPVVIVGLAIVYAYLIFVLRRLMRAATAR